VISHRADRSFHIDLVAMPTASFLPIQHRLTGGGKKLTAMF
jgi:hypothetical protein